MLRKFANAFIVSEMSADADPCKVTPRVGSD